MIHICPNIDDSFFFFFFFCGAIDLECQKILNILDSYGECSGQQINKSKTTIFFSKYTLNEQRECIKITLGVLEIK